MHKKIKSTLTSYWDFLDQSPYSVYFIILLALPMLLQNLWVPGMHPDGLIYAAASKNAANHGHWFVPFINKSYFPEFFEHPPFFVMYQAVLFKIFGVSWTVARLSNIILALLTIFHLRAFLKKFSTPQIAQWAAVIMLLSIPFVKKSRFPNMDIGLTLFSMLTFFHYYQALISDHWKQWLKVGLFLGLAFLMKGFPALFIPLACFIHILWIRRYNLLISPKVWSSIIIGVLIFSIWPALLYFQGKGYGFELWLNKQFFGTVVNSRGVQESSYLLYIKELSKTTLPWFLLSIFATIKAIKIEKRDHWIFLAIIWFLSILLPFSLINFKYSHYILPLYPALAVIAAYGASQFKKFNSNQFLKGIYTLAFCSLILFISFPIATKVHRNIEVIPIA